MMSSIVPKPENLASLVHLIRGEEALRQAAKRNMKRFPVGAGITDCDTKRRELFTNCDPFTFKVTNCDLEAMQGHQAAARELHQAAAKIH